MRCITRILCFAFLLSPACIRAQNAAEDFRKVNAAYEAAGVMSMEVDYFLYEDHKSIAPFEKQTGTYLRSGSSSLMRLSGIETLVNKQYLLVCDHNDKMILLGDPGASAQPSDMDPAALLKICSAVRFAKQDNGTLVYRLEFDKTSLSEYSVLEISIDPSSFFITKLVMYYRFESVLREERNAPATTPRLEIVYRQIKTNVKIKGDEFSESRFIKGKGKDVVCNEKYSEYKLINQKLTP